MKLGVAELLSKVNELRDESQQLVVLRNNDSAALRAIIQGAFHPNAKWLLPRGNPPYRPNDLPDLESVFHSEYRKLYLFIDGGIQNLNQVKRERLFIEMLERLAPADAELLLSIKDKIFPYDNISEETVKRAFPGLIP
jgi:hypothetical protein